jgi:hypothetical protein
VLTIAEQIRKDAPNEYYPARKALKKSAENIPAVVIARIFGKNSYAI